MIDLQPKVDAWPFYKRLTWSKAKERRKLFSASFVSYVHYSPEESLLRTGSFFVATHPVP
jgi:hypothetical protein